MTTASLLYPRDKAIDDLLAAVDQLRSIGNEDEARRVQGRLLRMLELASEARHLAENISQAIEYSKTGR